MSSILVTGGAGFIGSHTCLKLLENGFTVFVIDSFCKSSSSSLEIIKQYFKNNQPKLKNDLYYFKGNIKNISVLDDIFKFAKKIGEDIKAVIHLAGFKSVSDSIYNPLMYWDNNFCGTISLLKSMMKNDCRCIVFSSSATIYEPNKNELIKEDTKINPINPYGNTKAAIETLLNDIYKSKYKEWRIANLRYFNPVGAHPNCLIGEVTNSDASNLFPNIIKVAKGIVPYINIYGNDWPSKDGTCIRDYIHIMDLAEGHIKALKFLLSNDSKFININLGTGIGKSVLEVIKTFEEINELKIPYVFKNRRLGDRGKVVANISFSKDILNWAPVFNLSDMCRDAWNWEKSNLIN